MATEYPYRIKRYCEQISFIYDHLVLVGSISRNKFLWYGYRPDGSPVLDIDGKPVTAKKRFDWRTPELWRNP